MVKALATILRLFVTVPAFELAGAGLVIAGVWLQTGMPWGLVAAGGAALLKSFDLALPKGD